MGLCIFDHHLYKKEQLVMLKQSGSTELYQIKISEKYKTPTSQLYHEEYFNNNYFNWKLKYLCRSKVQSFAVQNTKQYTFAIKMLFKLKKVESTMCLFCTTDSDTCIYLLQVQKL